MDCSIVAFLNNNKLSGINLLPKKLNVEHVYYKCRFVTVGIDAGNKTLFARFGYAILATVGCVKIKH